MALRGVPSLLSALSQAAHPDEVAQAVVEGPGRAFGARAGAILWARPPHLVVLGLHGYAPDEVNGFETVSLFDDYPLVRSFLEGEPLIDDNTKVAERYAAMGRPTGRWARLRDRMGAGSTVSAPIVARGVPVGGWALNCSGRYDWTSFDVAVLEAIGSALGLWMTHPSSGLPWDRSEGDEPTLTPRQEAVLRLLADKKTNAAIAATIGVSSSTVKIEIARILRILRASDRETAIRRAGELGLSTTPKHRRKR